LDNHHLYLDKANEVCRNIFEKEYFNGLGIPLPEVKFIQPDSDNFKSGEYYIRIGDTWQIHLNFGLLPTNLLKRLKYLLGMKLSITKLVRLTFLLILECSK
jgi:hypothetical protein